jgi:hypothetical protein
MATGTESGSSRGTASSRVCDVFVRVPIKTVSEANARDGHWSKRDARVSAQRQAVAFATRGAINAADRKTPLLPATVHLVRISPSEGLDDDNLKISQKAVRDQLAAELGLPNDRDKRIAFTYDQRRGREYAVEISITRGLPPDPARMHAALLLAERELGRLAGWWRTSGDLSLQEAVTAVREALGR